MPSLDDLHKSILVWDYNLLEKHQQLQGYASELQVVKPKYMDVDEYRSVLYPLLLEEFRASMQKVKRFKYTG